MTTRDIDRGLREFIRQMQIAKVTEVVVGVHQGDSNDGQQIAEYAAYNEFGTENIPERSFMRSAFDENLSSIKQDMDARYGQVTRGEINVKDALGLVGLRHQDQIKNKIDTNIPPPNAPATIAAKGSSRTLIDTGAMKNSIHYIVRPVR